MILQPITNLSWTSTGIHRVTSDASVMHRHGHALAGFAFSVFLADGTIKQGVSVRKDNHAVRTELLGYAAALAELPDDGLPAILLHDLNDLSLMLIGKVSYQPKIQAEVEILLEQTSRREVVLVRKSRETEHRECHRRIRKEILGRLPPKS